MAQTNTDGLRAKRLAELRDVLMDPHSTQEDRRAALDAVLAEKRTR